MILSFLVYPFMLFSMFLLFKIPFTQNNGNYIISNIDSLCIFRLIIGIAIFAFFTGVRWDVGIDQLSYLNTYNSLKYSDSFVRDDMEIGFVKLMKLFSRNGIHSAIFFAVIGLLQLCFSLTIFKNEPYVIPFFCIGLICGGIFFSWCNGMRQQLVLSLFIFISSYFLLEKKIILTLLLIFLLTYIHRSAVFLYIFVPLMYMNLQKFYIKQKWQFLILFSSLVLSQAYSLDILINNLDKILIFVGYDDRYNSEVLMRVGSREMNFGIRRFIFLLLDIVIICYSGKLRQFYSSKSYGYVFISFLFLIFMQPIFMSSLALSRFVDYFVVYRMFMLAYLMFYLYCNRSFKYRVINWFIFLLLFAHISVQIISDRGNHTDCIRYEFFWNK